MLVVVPPPVAPGSAATFGPALTVLLALSGAIVTHGCVGRAAAPAGASTAVTLAASAAEHPRHRVESAERVERVEPHPDVPVGRRLTAYVGPRFLTGDALVPEVRTVIADETGRVRALLRGLPPVGAYPTVTLPGALAVPGLHDAHVHLQGMGRALGDVQLLGAANPAEVKARVLKWAESHPHAAAIRGRGWDQSRFPNGAWPLWRDLDGADPHGRPILLSRVDGHAAWANRALLERAGITRATPDPAGGKILRDAAGDPTGVLVDNAIALVEDKLPPASPRDVERWLEAGLGAAADAGLTAVHDMGMSALATRTLVRMDAEGRVPLRVFVYLDDTDPGAADVLDERPSSARVGLMGVKLFADGAMGSRGAALLEDYHDDPGNRGLLLLEPDALRRRVEAIHRRGLAAAVHAIGDRGNRVVLDAFAAHPAPPGVRDRVEHAQLLSRSDIDRFAALGVTASMQPTHATSDMRWTEARVGPTRVKGAYAWRSLLDAGAALAFGSDAPVEDVRPILGIYAALTRQDDAGLPPEGFLPVERLGQREALGAFTAGAAAAVGMERHLGAITPGMLFDVTLLDTDAAARADAGEPRAWLETRPVATVLAGALRRRTDGAGPVEHEQGRSAAR